MATKRSIRDMLSENGRLSSRGHKAHHRWRFVANPQCCEKCREMNGQVAYGPKPVWYGHAQDREGRYNCRCRWVRDY